LQVAFGSDWEDYCIVYKDGSLKWTGVPDKLGAKLKALTPKHPTVCSVCLGPDGEWSAHAPLVLITHTLIYN
jgi:hypothetical protein